MHILSELGKTHQLLELNVTLSSLRIVLRRRKISPVIDTIVVETEFASVYSRDLGVLRIKQLFGDEIYLHQSDEIFTRLREKP